MNTLRGMMADRAQGEGRDGGGSGEQERPTAHAQAAYPYARAYESALAYAHARALVSLAAKGSGLVALSLSTVILLGGFVSSLERRDFFSITVISVIQAAGIFQDWENNVGYLIDFAEIFEVFRDRLFNLLLSKQKNPSIKSKSIRIIYFSSPVLLPCLVLISCVQLLYLLGPLACAAISSWCIAKLNNHGNRDGSDSMLDMMAALNIFYSLIILQGAMFLVLLLPMGIYDTIVSNHIFDLYSLDQLSKKWSVKAIIKYVLYISNECRKDSLSIKGMDLIKYAAELLDSEFQEDYLCGARLLGAFIKKGEDVRWLLLPSSHKVQKLIDSLRISSSLDENTEIRELAAVIVAHVAAHVDLAKYPGALGCISSVFQQETTRTYWNISKQASDPRPPQEIVILFKMLFQSKEKLTEKLIREKEARQWRLMRDQKRLRTGEERRQQKREGGISYELIQQGLTILERLASNNNNNRRLICSAPGLLPNITEPVYSATFIQDVKTKAWADIVTMCLKVLYQLIRAPGRPSRRLRLNIFSDAQALNNLKSILEPGNEPDHKELQLRAMEILTELALDLSINLTEEIKGGLIRKQLELFLATNGVGEESAAIAGRTLVSLSTNSESNSALIMTTQNGIIGRLTEILDDKENITRRTIAAEIMANLCDNCKVENMKEILLPKVLKEIMSIKTKPQGAQPRISADQNNPASGDEESQRNSVSINNDERHNISTQGNHTETEEISDQEMEEQEALLSLALVICDKLDSADLDGAILNAVQNTAGSEEQGPDAFVDKLKAKIDDNCHPTADSLKIVKLCIRIAESIMTRCPQYVEHVRNKGVKSSLSQASETMSELESCMLFVGTDFGPKKTVRPLLSEIEKKWSDTHKL